MIKEDKSFLKTNPFAIRSNCSIGGTLIQQSLVSFSQNTHTNQKNTLITASNGVNTALYEGEQEKLPFVYPETLKEVKRNYTREALFKDDFALLKEKFLAYRDFEQFGVYDNFVNEKCKNGVCGLDHQCVKKSFFPFAKKGNRFYIENFNRDLSAVRFDLLGKEFHAQARGNSRIIMDTLTYDPKKKKFVDAYLDAGTDFNRFISRLKRKFGDIDFVRFFEAHKSGAIHIHTILFFHSKSFSSHQDENEKNVFRVLGEKRFKDCWKWGRSDVRVVKNLKKDFVHLSKYVSKDLTDPDGKGILSQALAWYFGKRQFGVSKRLKGNAENPGVLFNLITNKSNSNKILEKLGCFTNCLCDVPVERDITRDFLGFVSARERLEIEKQERKCSVRSLPIDCSGVGSKFGFYAKIPMPEGFVFVNKKKKDDKKIMRGFDDVESF